MLMTLLLLVDACWIAFWMTWMQKNLKCNTYDMKKKYKHTPSIGNVKNECGQKQQTTSAASNIVNTSRFNGKRLSSSCIPNEWRRTKTTTDADVAARTAKVHRSCPIAHPDNPQGLQWLWHEGKPNESIFSPISFFSFKLLHFPFPFHLQMLLGEKYDFKYINSLSHTIWHLFRFSGTFNAFPHMKIDSLSINWK